MQSELSQAPNYGTPSPNKRSTFRSKTKLKDMGSTMESKLKNIPSFYVYIRDFPLDTPEDVINIIKTLEPTNNSFAQHLENLKLYKPNLSSLLQDSWAESMQILKAVVIKLSKRGDKQVDEKEKKVAELLRINRQLQKEQLKWKQRIQKLQHLRELQNAQLNMVDAELQLVSVEMRDIYKLLEGDMSKVGNYLTKLQERKALENEEGSNQIYGSLKTMSLLLGNMQNQQRNANSSLENMRELIKAMTKSTKVSTSTQVDESQLLTKAGAIFNNTEQQPFHIADANSINVQNVGHQHLIDQLKAKEKIQPHQNFKLEKHADKPWVLTATIMAFLENMGKENQAGKVLPWQYTKQVIAEIYNERISYQTDIMSGGIGNGMLFDEFVVFFFITKYRIRRLAELKLLEFIISLKYYTKFWPKAERFCEMMDVMKYQPLFEQPEGFDYQLDYNVQHFFFIIYKKLNSFQMIEEEGQTYVDKSSAKKLLKASLFFSEDYQKSRLLAKLDKDSRVFDKVQYCDFDWALSIMLDEYFSTKKRICNNLNKLFSKKFEENQGYFSIDDLKDLFSELSTIYRPGNETQYRYPLKSDLQLGKLYLYACTSGRNGYDLNATNFISACQRYGFDAPFPFLHLCSKKKTQESKQLQGNEESKRIKSSKEHEKVIIKQRQELNFYQEQKVKGDGTGSVNQQRIDIGAKIFSQHFSILRELRTYVQIFHNTLREEKNVELVWKSFDQIRQVLEKGCEFMKYPLLDKKK